MAIHFLKSGMRVQDWHVLAEAWACFANPHRNTIPSWQGKSPPYSLEEGWIPYTRKRTIFLPAICTENNVVLSCCLWGLHKRRDFCLSWLLKAIWLRHLKRSRCLRNYYVLFTLDSLTRSLFGSWHPSAAVTAVIKSKHTVEMFIIKLLQGLR